MTHRVRSVVASVPLAALVLAGCGDSGGGGTDSEQIAEVARFVVSAPLSGVCQTHFTEDFVRTVFGDLDTCMSSGTANGATTATVTAIAIDGDTATAAVAEQGGTADGAAGTWGFARDAEGWRVAEWRIDYLRAVVKAELGPAYQADGADDPFADATARACVLAKFQALANAEFRATAFAVLRESEAAGTALRTWYYDCLPGGAEGLSALRRIFEDGLRQADIPSEVVECAILALRKTVSDAEIRRMGKSGATSPPAGVQKRIEKATADCVDSTGAA